MSTFKEAPCCPAAPARAACPHLIPTWPGERPRAAPVPRPGPCHPLPGPRPGPPVAQGRPPYTRWHSQCPEASSHECCPHLRGRGRIGRPARREREGRPGFLPRALSSGRLGGGPMPSSPRRAGALPSAGPGSVATVQPWCQFCQCGCQAPASCSVPGQVTPRPQSRPSGPGVILAKPSLSRGRVHPQPRSPPKGQCVEADRTASQRRHRTPAAKLRLHMPTCSPPSRHRPRHATECGPGPTGTRPPPQARWPSVQSLESEYLLGFLFLLKLHVHKSVSPSLSLSEGASHFKTLPQDISPWPPSTGRLHGVPTTGPPAHTAGLAQQDQERRLEEGASETPRSQATVLPARPHRGLYQPSSDPITLLF